MMVTTPRTPAAKSAAKTKAPAKSRTAARPRAAPKPSNARSSALTATTLSIGAAILTVGAAIAGLLTRRRTAGAATDDVGHPVPDLALDRPHPTAEDRAPIDFRPDIDAPISAADREALRPATGPAPSLAAEAGTLNSQTGASN